MQPLSEVEVTHKARRVKRGTSIAVGGVERGAHAMQPLRDVDVTILASKVQWGTMIVGGVHRGACAVQPLHDVEVTLHAGFVQLGQAEHTLCNHTVARSSRKPLGTGVTKVFLSGH